MRPSSANTSSSPFSWQRAKVFGDAAATEVAQALTRRGHRVVDISQLKDAQRRGIDLLVDGDYYDVKADRHKADNVFLETVSFEDTGCFYKSRADYWLYWFPAEGKLYRIHLPKAQAWVAKHYGVFRRHQVNSYNGENTWQSEGLLVPVEALLDAGVVEDWSDVMRDESRDEMKGVDEDGGELAARTGRA